MASEIVTLDNKHKSTLIYEHSSRLPIVSVQIIFDMAGSLADEKSGTSYVLTKMLSEGTKSKGHEAFALELESKAINLSVRNGKQTLVFEISALAENYDYAMNALWELLSDPNFTQERLDKVKSSIMGRLSSQENDYDYVAKKALQELLFEGTPMGKVHSKESIESITLEDIKTFYTKHITQKALIAVMGGAMSKKDAINAVEKTLKVLPEGETIKRITANVRTKSATKEIIKDTQQAYIYFGAPFNIAPDDSDYYKARVAMFILGAGGFGTRLMEEIRVKQGLAYSAYARMVSTQSFSYMMGYLQTKLESGDKATKIVKQEIEKFIKKGVTQEELDAARDFILGSEPLRLETLSQRLYRTFDNYYNGLALDNTQKELKAIKALSLDELNAFIDKHPEIIDISVVTVTK